MQQSSQIFVFSTQWANKAAESVMQGAYSTIICWHENQPETKKHLEVRYLPTIHTKRSPRIRKGFLFLRVVQLFLDPDSDLDPACKFRKYYFLF